MLISRQAGKEAYAAFLPTLEGVRASEDVTMDFEGVKVFSPSRGDEFLTPLQKQYGKRLWLKNTANPSVALTIETLAGINGVQFQIR